VSLELKLIQNKNLSITTIRKCRIGNNNSQRPGTGEGCEIASCPIPLTDDENRNKS